jgi:hypothetical protein
MASTTSILQGNVVKSYYPEAVIRGWLDDSAQYGVSRQFSDHYLRDFRLKTGNLVVENITLRQNYGSPVPPDSLFTPSEKHQGTLGADLFRDRILVIDFPRSRMCVLDSLDRLWKRRTVFTEALSKRGRLHIPLTVGGRTRWFLFDTGASLFPVNTGREVWLDMAGPEAPTDTINANSWGEKVTFYGGGVAQKVFLGRRPLKPNMVWYHENPRLLQFNREENIDGLVGNACFFEDIVLLDFRHSRFGIVKTQ